MNSIRVYNRRQIFFSIIVVLRKIWNINFCFTANFNSTFKTHYVNIIINHKSVKICYLFRVIASTGNSCIHSKHYWFSSLDLQRTFLNVNIAIFIFPTIHNMCKHIRFNSLKYSLKIFKIPSIIHNSIIRSLFLLIPIMVHYSNFTIRR